MLRALQIFLRTDAPTQAQAAAALRTLFVLAFGGQVLVVAVAWLVLLVVFTPEPAVQALTAQALVGLGVLGLPAVFALGTLSAGGKSQAGALTAALLEGGLLAVPAWSALFVWTVGSPARYISLLLTLLALSYGLGVWVVARHAAQATGTTRTIKAAEKPL